QVMRWIAISILILVCTGCTRAFSDKVTRQAVPETTKQGAAYIVDALDAGKPELALPVAKEVSKKIGEPKERLEVSRVSTDSLVTGIPSGVIGIIGLGLGALLLIGRKFLPV
ncbi:MAG: hypothetical protein IH898_11930, partial [Planctomycetes bacterium]|nr:hypothetical protein [Planctomycetota bacterium]